MELKQRFNSGKRTNESVFMNRKDDKASIILVVEDVHETRDGIEKLLHADGYRVALARDEEDAAEIAQRQRPDLILVSLAGLQSEVIVTARRIRERADIGENVPIVVFCIAGIGEGDEVAIGQNVYVTRPDNFNQLRRLLIRLLQKIPIAASRDTADLNRSYSREMNGNIRINRDGFHSGNI
jgi:CheY-like chemotaxis protein